MNNGFNHTRILDLINLKEEEQKYPLDLFGKIRLLKKVKEKNLEKVPH